MGDSQTFYFKNIVFNPDDPDLSETDRLVVYAALRKLTACARVNARLGPTIAEERTRMKKNISTEMCIFQGVSGRTQVYLQKRDSLAKNPLEPYPDMYCAWGTGHEAFESVSDTFYRVQKKLGTEFPLAIPVEMFPKEGEYLLEAEDSPRGVYLLRIFVTVPMGNAVSPNGHWFCIEDIPWNELVPSHRHVIIPRAIQKFQQLCGQGWQWQLLEQKTI